MADRIDKNTVVPIGIAISVTMFFMYSAINITTKYARLEANVSNLMSVTEHQKDNIGSFRQQITELNNNVIRLSQIIENLEEKIK